MPNLVDMLTTEEIKLVNDFLKDNGGILEPQSSEEETGAIGDNRLEKSNKKSPL